MLEIKNLNKTFYTGSESFCAVDNIDLTVEEGEICILLGTSGCGKTTTLKMVNRLIEPTEGEILINGESIFNASAKELRKNIGYVIQSIGLFPNMTILENITVVPKLLSWTKAERLKRAEELLEMVALPTTKEFMSRYPYQLSGGQQQRIGVIRAMAGRPKLLLMDEAFGAIDPINRVGIQEEFKKIAKKNNLTVLFVSHDIDEALKLGDSIAIFDKGKIVQKDSAKELLSNPKNEFVRNFLGIGRQVKRLKLYYAHEALDNSVTKDPEARTIHMNEPLLRASSQLYAAAQEQLICVDDDNNEIGIVTHNSIHKLLSSNT